MNALGVQCNGKRGDYCMKRVPLQVRINQETKEAAVLTCTELGLSISDAINVFLTAFVKCGGFPFDVQTGNSSDIKMLSYGLSLKEIVDRYDIKPEDLDGWEDVEIE